MSKVKEYIKNVVFGIKIIGKIAPGQFALNVFFTILFAALPYVSLFVMKELINSIVSFVSESNIKAGTILLLAVLYGSLLLAADIIRNISVFFAFKYSQSVEYYLDNLMVDKVSKIKYDFFDSSDLSDKLSYTEKIMGSMIDIETTLVNVVSAIAQVVISAVLLGALFPWIIPIVVVFMIPIMRNQYIEKRQDREFNKQFENSGRRRHYYKNIFFGKARFEIMLYDLKDFFIKRHNMEWCEWYEASNKKDFRQLCSRLLANAALFVTDIIFYFYLGVMALKRVIGVGDLSYYISLVSNFQDKLGSFVEAVTSFNEVSDELTDVRDFIYMDAVEESSGTAVPVPEFELEFEHVSFKYPEAEEYVLKDCSFKIGSKEKVGLVGINGSGKSTITKLLLRLYDPSEGVIKLNGIPLYEYDLKKYRRLFGVLFQNYTKYSMSAKENITLSDVRSFDEKRLDKACKYSQIDGIIKEWEKGFDEQLTKRFSKNGKELSGGQWQRFSLARAFYRNASVVLLDEPSASLDPVAEHKIFEDFQKLASNKSALLISHRLSNVMGLDRIIVLDEGHIVESGTHSQLLRFDGKYARMFKAQAEKYSL